MEIGRSRIILGQGRCHLHRRQIRRSRGPYVRAEELHAIGRMNGLGSYVKTRDSFLTIPRIPFDEWKQGKR